MSKFLLCFSFTDIEFQNFIFDTIASKQQNNVYERDFTHKKFFSNKKMKFALKFLSSLKIDFLNRLNELRHTTQFFVNTKPKK